MPIADAGYYSRQAALRLLLQQFLHTTHSKASQPIQILSLGAGFDTTWFQLQASGRYTAAPKTIKLHSTVICTCITHIHYASLTSQPQAEGAAPSRYFEVDFKEVTKRKAAVIAKRDVLHQMVGGRVQPQDIGVNASV